VFSTNLDPDSLMDEAFLRRLRHKIHIGPPSRGMLEEIFKLTCSHRGLQYDPAIVDYLFRHFYSPVRPPRSSDPRDLVEIAGAICRFRGESPRLDQEVLSEAARRFFCPLQGVVSG
jgi:SpoVK/Ycf46/Vps4 family AAA+-type ATPase